MKGEEKLRISLWVFLLKEIERPAWKLLIKTENGGGGVIMHNTGKRIKENLSFHIHKGMVCFNACGYLDLTASLVAKETFHKPLV